MSASSRPTALITGASAGIGAAFARRLAADGYDLILVARRKERLEALAVELASHHAIHAEAFPADLSDPGEVQRVADRNAVCETLSLLVNNAGFGLGGAIFAEAEIQPQLDMLQVHVGAMLHLTRAALPGMIARHAGGVINVSSVAAFVPRANNTMYHMTKAAMIAFTDALRLELRGTGVKVQALCPGFTLTEFHDGPQYQNLHRPSRPNLLWMSADRVVAASLADLQRGKWVCVPGWPYQLAVALINGPFTRPVARWVAAGSRRR